MILTMMMGFGSFLPLVVGPHMTIKAMAEISCLFPLLMLATFPFMPDSPYYLMRLGKEDEAKKALKWLRHQKEDEAVQGEISQIKKLVENNFSFLGCLKEIKNKPNPKALFLIFTTIVGQQFCGATVVSFYQEQIYAASNIPITPYKAVIISSVISMIFGVASMFIIDRWGRKPLLIISSLGCCISTALIALYYQLSFLQDTYPAITWLPIICTNTLMVAFGLGLAPIPYTMLGEVFSSSFKEIAVCIISVSGAIVSFIVTKLFQILNDEFGPSSVFYTLSTVTFMMMVIIVIYLPETMNKTLLDIQNLLIDGSTNKLSPKANKINS